MAQKRIIANRQKKKNKGIVIGSTTAAVLVIVGGILYATINDNEASDTAVNSITMSDSNAASTGQQQAEDVPVQQDIVVDEEPSSAADVQAEAPVQQQTQQAVEDTVERDETPVEKEEKVQQPDAKAVDATKYIDGQAPATEPTYIKGILLANKQYPLPQSYSPGVDATAQKALDSMLASAKTAGFPLTAFSGFRSYEYQNTLYTNYVARDGQQEADRYSARPGYSEHQTGLAFDIGEVGKEDLWLTDAFGETDAGKWLVDHAHEYGFILRYPQGKEHLTGFMYESWHFRYVGKEAATAIQQRGVTLEEYLGVYDDVTSREKAAPIADATQPKPAEEQAQVGAKTNYNN